MGLFDRFKKGLEKTRESMVASIQQVFRRGIKLDEDTLDQLEETLISADMGVKSAVQITQNIQKRLKEEKGEATMASVLSVIRGDVKKILTDAKPKVHPPTWDSALEDPNAKKSKKKGKHDHLEPAIELDPAATALHVIFIVGVNGTGKTTSIAKLARLYQNDGHQVLLAAGDTFRAAAVEQLQVWAERVGVPCITQGHGADPAAVVYDSLSAAIKRGCDTVIVDTAGRLHTKSNLMDELAKVARVIKKKTGKDPETLLVIDANTGQNGLQQAKIFAETIPVDGLILTKLDGTAKGGIVVAIAETIGLPVKYVGMGETADDIAVFDAEAFVEALLAEVKTEEEYQQ
jgi:fused signal recognition particle receptor